MLSKITVRRHFVFYAIVMLTSLLTSYRVGSKNLAQQQQQQQQQQKVSGQNKR